MGAWARSSGASTRSWQPCWCSNCASQSIFSLTPFTTNALARAFGDPANLATAVRFITTLLTIATLIFAAVMLYTRRVGLFRDNLDTEAFTLYFRLSLVVWVVPVSAYWLSFLSPGGSLAVLVVLYLFALLPIEEHGQSTVRAP